MAISPRELLEQGVYHLEDERRIVSGIAVSYGDRSRGEAFCRGRIREVRLENGKQGGQSLQNRENRENAPL